MKQGLLVIHFLSGAKVHHLLELVARSRALKALPGNLIADVASAHFTLALELKCDF